jgi:hypothetical protein
VRAATLVRLGLGGACLVVPSEVLGLVGGPDRDDRRTLLAARVLGGRLVLQGIADLAWGRRTRGVAVAVDLAHAASMLPIAHLWPAHRRTALVSAAAASLTALLDTPRSGNPIRVVRLGGGSSGRSGGRPETRPPPPRVT